MAGMSEKDSKEVSKKIKEILVQAQSQHHAVEEIAKLTSPDPVLAKLAKEMSTSFKPFHKAARALLDKMK